MTFSQDITRFVAKTKLRPSVVLRKLAFDAYAGVLLLSPVDTGFFRSKWRIGINRRHLDDASDKPPKRNKANRHAKAGKRVPVNAKERAAATGYLASAQFGDTIYITNNTSYGKYLEEGSSKQAPLGIVRITFLRLKQNFERTVRSVVGSG